MQTSSDSTFDNESIFTNRRIRKLFMSFLKKERSLEIYEFIEEVEKLNNDRNNECCTISKDNLDKRTFQLVDKYYLSIGKKSLDVSEKEKKTMIFLKKNRNIENILDKLQLKVVEQKSILFNDKVRSFYFHKKYSQKIKKCINPPKSFLSKLKKSKSSNI
jgi:hypothetical protein